jgi:hypothetical protein
MTSLISQAISFDTGVITYYPGRGANSATWDSPLDVLTHLLLQPEDRDCLRNEASRISPYQDQTFFIVHPLLNRRLVVTSFDTDRQLARTIQTLHLVIAVECGQLHSTLPFVIWHTQHVLIRDPFKLVVDPGKFARTLRLNYKNPIEILVLKNGDRIRPLAL